MSTPTIIDLFVSENTADWNMLDHVQLYNRKLLKKLPTIMPNEFDMYLHEKLKPLEDTPEKYFYESVLNLPETHKASYDKYKHFSNFVRSTPIPVRPVYFRDKGIPEYIWYAKINEILSKIPRIRYMWDGRNLQWRVETADFVPPPEYGKSLQEQAILRHRRIVSYETAIRCQRIFGLYGTPSIQTPRHNQWGRASICMFADKGGFWLDGVSPCDFLLNVFDTFRLLLRENIIKQKVFLYRLPYLQFFESMTDEDYDHANPVHRYIFDQFVGQDICSYM